MFSTGGWRANRCRSRVHRGARQALGKLVWKTEKYRHGYGSPMTFQHNGEPRIAVLNNDFLLVLRARDGHEIDKYRWETPSSTAATTPIVHGNTIFISTG